MNTSTRLAQRQRKAAYIKALCLFILTLPPLIGAPQGKDPTPLQSAANSPQDQILEKLASLGAHVFKQSGRVVEVNLNGTKAADADLRLLAELSEITDLSLEQTQVSDAGKIGRAHV